jgi:hypothetical protein
VAAPKPHENGRKDSLRDRSGRPSSESRPNGIGLPNPRQSKSVTKRPKLARPERAPQPHF